MNRSKPIEILNNQKVIILKHIQLVKTLIFLFLVSYIRTNGRLIMPNSKNAISSGPEMLAGKIPAAVHKVPRYVDCTLSFDETNHLR
jgi:hypothetical protein